MNYSRASLLLWGGFIGMAAFVVGRTTAPSGVSASASDRSAASAENNRQIAIAVKKEIEESMRNRMPTLVRQGIEAFEQSREIPSTARLNSILSTLQTVQTQLNFYKVQHGDRFPTFSDMREWLAMLNKTDAQGKVNENGPFGPYLSQRPMNVANGLTKIAQSGHPTRDCGWTYDEKTGRIRALLTHEDFDKLSPDIEKADANCFEYLPEN